MFSPPQRAGKEGLRLKGKQRKLPGSKGERGKWDEVRENGKDFREFKGTMTVNGGRMREAVKDREGW